MVEDTFEEFTKGKITQKAVNELFDDLKNSDYWQPEVPRGTSFIFILIAVVIFAIFMVPAWILLANESIEQVNLFIGYALVLIGIVAPAVCISCYAKSQNKRYEARDADFKERLIEHNRKNFIPHDMPIKMALFGAYFVIERPNAKSENVYGPLVSVGRKKLNQEEKKYELAYLDVDEEVDYVQNPLRNSSTSKPQNSPRDSNTALNQIPGNTGNTGVVSVV